MCGRSRLREEGEKMKSRAVSISLTTCPLSLILEEEENIGDTKEVNHKWMMVWRVGRRIGEKDGMRRERTSICFLDSEEREEEEWRREEKEDTI